MAENGLISGVEDIPGYLANNFPALTGPARVVGNAMRLPLDVGADALKSGVHSAVGLENPTSYTSDTIDSLIKSLQDTYAPVAKAKDAASTGIGDVMDKIRESLVESGARPAVAAPAKGGGPTRAAPAMTSADFEDASMGPVSSPSPAPVRRSLGATPTGGRGGSAAPPMPPASLPAATAAPADAVGAFGGQQVPEVPVSTWGDQYQKRSAALRKEPKGDLTQGQKDALALEFWMNVMAKSAHPGSGFLGAFGEAGGDTAKTARGQIDKNLATDAATMAREHADLTAEMGFREKDAAHELSGKTLQETTRHRLGTERDSARKLDLLQQQLEQGNWHVLDNGKSGTYVLFDKKTKQTFDTGIKSPAAKDNTPAEVRLLQALRDDPSLLETANAYNKGRQPKSDETPEAKILSEANKLAAGSMGSTTLDQAIDQQLAAVNRLRGGGAALPPGLPEGSKAIGTKDGKRVFEKPDGTRVIEK